MATKETSRRIKIFLNNKEVNNDIKSIAGEFRRLKNTVAGLDRESDEYKRGIKDLRRLKGVLNEHNGLVNKTGSAWSKAKSFALGFVSGTAILGGLRKLGQGLKNALNTVLDFNQAQADTAAVLGKNAKDIRALTADSLRLGASTKFTASEVSKLQKEFAKLGFTEDEILNATEATLNLAAATNTDLAEAAEVAGNVVRGFGLDAEETGRVTDVMALSFSRSALDMEKFREAMKNVAPIAKAAGATVEETTAILGKLADAGISGTRAGTALKKIFNELSKDGKPLSESLANVRTQLAGAGSASERLAIANNLVGERAQAALLVIANQTEEIGGLEHALDNASGAAERMADTQLDTLSGDVTKLGSAWDGFVLSIENGEGPIGGAIRGILQFATNTLGLFTNTTKLSDSIREEQAELNALVISLKSSGEGTERRKKLIAEINRNYPNFLKGLDQENLSNEELSKRLADVNKQYVAKIILQEKEEEIQAAARKTAEVVKGLQKKEREELKRLIRLEKELLGATQDNLSARERASKINKAIQDQGKGGIFGERLISGALLDQADERRSLESGGQEIKVLQDELKELEERYSSLIPEIEGFNAAVSGNGIDADLETVNTGGGVNTSADNGENEAEQQRLQDLRDELQKFEQDAALIKATAEEKEIAAVNERFDRLKTAAQGYSEESIRVEELRLETIAGVKAKFAEQEALKEEETRQKLLQMQQEFLDQLEFDELSADEQAEVLALQRLDAQLEAAQAAITDKEKLAEIEKQLTEKTQKEINAIYQKSAAERLEADKTNNERALLVRKQAIETGYNLVSSALNSLNILFGKQNEFAKANIYFQLAIDQASAISTMIKDGAKVGVTPLEKAIAIGTGIATVLANFATAKQSLDGLETPTFHTGTGGKGFQPLSGTANELDVIDPRTGRLEARIEKGEEIIRKEAVNDRTLPIITAINEGRFNPGNIPSVNSTAVQEAFTLEKAGLFNELAAEEISGRDGIETNTMAIINRIESWQRSFKVVQSQRDVNEYEDRAGFLKRISQIV